MTYFKRYFTYRLRTTAFRTLIISIIAAVLSNAITSSSGSRTGVDSGFEIIGIFIGIAAVLFPMLETYQLKQRRTLDLVFALPVTKAQLALAHFLSGLCQMLAVSLVTCISTMVAIMAKNADVIKAGNTPFAVGWIIPYFLVAFLGGVCFYSITTFLFSQGNTVGDGLVFTFGVPGGFYLITYYIGELLADYYALDQKIEDALGGIIINLSNCFLLLSEPGVYFQDFIEPGRFDYSNRSYTGYKPMSRVEIITCVLWVIFAVAAFFGYIWYQKNYRAERAGGISDSFFGYRVLIPLYGCILILMNGSGIDLLFLTFVLVAMAVAYFVYRRSFRIKYADIACIVFAFLMVFTGGVL